MSDDATYSVNDLSAAACYALVYTQALVYGPKSVQYANFVKAERVLRLSGADKRQALGRGLVELTDMGIIECERDGEGDLMPKRLHEERIRAADARLVTRDLS